MNQVERFLERPKLYYNIDGVGELGIGFMCLGYSLLGWLQLHTPGTSIWHRMYTFVIYMAVMLCIIHYGSKSIKEHITYARTGFVEYRKTDRLWTAIAAFTFSALFSLGLIIAVRRHWEISNAGFLVGLLFAASYVRIARTVRWKWAIFGVVVAGVLAIAALPADLLEALVDHTSLTSAMPAKAVGTFWLMMAFYGVVLMISGGISFWLYLRHTEAPAQEGE